MGQPPLRLEYRYDEADRSVFPNDHGAMEENHQDTIATDLVFTF
jgi:hypothetical protein